MSLLKVDAVATRIVAPSFESVGDYPRITICQRLGKRNVVRNNDGCRTEGSERLGDLIQVTTEKQEGIIAAELSCGCDRMQ